MGTAAEKTEEHKERPIGSDQRSIESRILFYTQTIQMLLENSPAGQEGSHSLSLWLYSKLGFQGTLPLYTEVPFSNHG